jgi:hypothetical protein
MALRLAEVEPRDYTYVCTPTGDELPEMFDHWLALGRRLGKPIIPVMRESLEHAIDRQQALPNHRMRWCTRILKIEPFAAWLRTMTERDEVTTYVGLRADEPLREGGDYQSITGVVQDFPLRRWGWGLSEVLRYLVDAEQDIPARTDCARCFFQTLPEWWELWKVHPAIYADAEAMELRIGHTFRSPGRDTWPAGLRELRERFERGDIPMRAKVNGDLFRSAQCRVCRL